MHYTGVFDFAWAYTLLFKLHFKRISVFKIWDFLRLKKFPVPFISAVFLHIACFTT